MVDEKDREGTIKATEYADDISIHIDHEWENSLREKFKIRRFNINPIWKDEVLIKVQKEFSNRFQEKSFRGFKIYWDYYSSSIKIYKDAYDFKAWNSMDFNQSILKYKEGIDQVITELAKIKKSV